MAIVLRERFELSDDDEIVIHMGAGVHADVVRAALRIYHEYAGIAGRPGAFTMSVFAAIGGVSKDDILTALPHHRFGVATLRHLAGPSAVADDHHRDGDPGAEHGGARRHRA